MNILGTHYKADGGCVIDCEIDEVEMQFLIEFALTKIIEEYVEEITKEITKAERKPKWSEFSGTSM